MTSRLAALALFVAAPLAAQASGSAAEIVKRMTPEERAMAQAKLNSAAKVFYDTPIDSVKAELRSVLVVMRDSMLIVEAEAARMQRGGSPAVITATARRFRGACAAAWRVAGRTQPRVEPLRTSAEIGDRALAEYRKTLAETLKLMGECDRNVGALLGGPGPDADRLRALAQTATAASVRYEAAADGVLRTLDIPMRPKGVPGGL